MAYEILVLDVDGTLMRTDKVISEKTINEIVRVQEEGIKVAIASGRCTAGIMPTARKIRLDEFGGYIVSYNGGCISNCQTGEIVYNINLPDGIVQEIYEFSKNEKTGIMTYHENDIIAENDADQYIQIDAKGCDIDIHVVENFGKEVTYPVNKCLLTGDPEYMAQVEPRAAKAFEGRLSVYRSEDFYVEMMPLGIDKAYGLSKLLKRLGYTRSQMICCGDGFNDISMIEYAGLGVAMANASEQVREHADYIAPHCDKDGLVDVIRRFITV